MHKNVSCEFLLTNSCNLRCSYCIASKLPGTAMTPLMAEKGVDLFFDLADGAERIEITFSGGEPLVALPVLELIVMRAERRARDTGMEVTFVLKTNGMTVNQRVIHLLKRHSFRVVVSIDGLPDVHDTNRVTKNGRGTHARICAGIEKLKKCDIAYVASMTVHPDSAARIRESVEYLHNRGLDQIDLGPAYGTVNWTEEAAASLASSLADVARYMRDVRTSGGCLLVSPLDPESGHANGDLLESWGCHAALTNLAFLPNGQIAGCSALAMIVDEFPELVLGDVFAGLSQAAVDRTLSLSQADRQARPSCRQCRTAHNCTGGCIAINYPTTRHPLIPPPLYCNTIAAIAPAWQLAWGRGVIAQ